MLDKENCGVRVNVVFLLANLVTSTAAVVYPRACTEHKINSHLR